MNELGPEEARAISALVDSEVARRLYEDGMSSTVSEVSKFGTDVVKTVRLFTAPVQLLATLQDRLAASLERVRAKVPPDRQQDAPPQIVGPALEHMKYIPEDDVVAQMFEELLACSIHADRVAEAHPSFVHIISQLSRDEAVILRELSTRDFEVVDALDLDKGNNRFVNRQVESSTLPEDLLFRPESIELYYSHLESLSLVQWPIVDQKPIDADGTQIGVRRKSRMHLTEFGRLFARACIPEDGFRE